MNLRPAREVSTAPLTALGLVGGYLVARESGVRPLGGLLLGAAGAYAGRTWLETTDAPTTTGLAALYLGGFGASHPLAKKIGAWPSVLAVAAASAGASYLLVDSKNAEAPAIRNTVTD